MEAQILIQRLEDFLQNKNGDVSIEADKLRTVLGLIKRLEGSLAEALRLAYQKSSKKRLMA